MTHHFPGQGAGALTLFTALGCIQHPSRLVIFALIYKRFTCCASAPFRVGYGPIQPVMNSRRLSAAGIRFSQHPLPTGGIVLPYGWTTGQIQTPLGLSCSALVRCERVRCLLYAGVCGVRTGAFEIPFSRMTQSCRIIHVSAVCVDDASEEGSREFTLPFFALPWVR